MTSPDGITWTTRTSAADNGWFSVTYGNGLFVAVALSNALSTPQRVMISGGILTTTTLASSANPSTYGNSVTFTATVSATSGSPTGTVNFKDNGTSISGCASQPLASGTATCVTSSLSVGNHPITAEYSGDSTYATSIGTLTGGQTVNAAVPAAPTNLSATSGDASAVLTWTAPASDGGSAITSYDYSLDDGATWTSFNPVVTASPATITGLTNGTPYLVKLRAVNSAGPGAASAAVSVTPVSSATPSITTLTSNLNPSTVGTSVTFTATVAAATGGTSIIRLLKNLAGAFNGGTSPTGAVEFFDGTTSLGTGALDGAGEATLSTSALTAGTRSITAVYAGDASYQTSTSTAWSQMVQAAQTITFANPGTQAFGTTPTLTASASSGLTPTFTSATTSVCTITTGGLLTFVSPGTCTINADQAGNDDFAPAPQVQQAFAVLATQATGNTAGGPVTANITGGTCLGYANGSAQFTVPTGAPAGQTFPYGVFGFTALNCVAGGTVTITLTYPAALPTGAKYWKNISGTWVDWTSKVTIAGNTVVLTLTDGGEGDTNPNPSEISDPSGPAFASGPGPLPNPIPTLPEWGQILLLFVMIGVVGWHRHAGRRLG